MSTRSAQEAKANFEKASAAVDAAMAGVRVDRSQANLEALAGLLQTLQDANTELIEVLKEELTRQ